MERRDPLTGGSRLRAVSRAGPFDGREQVAGVGTYSGSCRQTGQPMQARAIHV